MQQMSDLERCIGEKQAASGTLLQELTQAKQNAEHSNAEHELLKNVGHPACLRAMCFSLSSPCVVSLYPLEGRARLLSWCGLMAHY